MGVCKMATIYIGVEEFIHRDEHGMPVSYNYNGIFSKMKNELLRYNISNNYKGKCKSFCHVFGRFYEKSYYGEKGIMYGSCINITSDTSTSFFVPVQKIINDAFNNNRSEISDAVILSRTENPTITYKEVIASWGTESSNEENPIVISVTENTVDLSGYSSKYSTPSVYLYSSPTIHLLGGWYDDAIVDVEGKSYRSTTIREPWCEANLAFHNYVKDYLSKDVKIADWIDAKPKSEQYSERYKSAIEWADWYITPVPVIYYENITSSDTQDKIKDIIDNDDTWTDATIKYPISTKTNWKIYIDGTKLPNYKILWENKDIEDLKDTDNARIQIQYAEVDAEYPVELRVNELIHETNFAEYNDGNYKTNFKTLYEGAWGEVYDESIMSNLPKQSVWLLLQLDYYGNGITTVLPTQSSTKMAILLNPSGKSLYSYADLWNTDGETDGSTIRVITDKGSGEGDDGYKDDTDKGEEDITDGASNSVGVLTTTYAMTIERLNQLGGFLWGANIFDEFSLVNSNPIENIISCKNIPISLSGTDEIIHLGNVDTGTNGAKVTSNFSTLNVGQIALPTKYNSFLDFAPYTKITIYLPYIGFKEIDSTIAIGKTLKVAYVADVITGGCIAQIFINGVRFYEFSGEMGVDIPITASNRAQVEASYISNAVGMGASLASGNITGAVDSVLASATAKYNYSSTDTPNPNCVASVNRTCYVIIERPTYQELSQFNHTKGKMCNLSKTIGSLKGFTICDANIDLKGITATEQEKQEISNILSSGFFA
mgnify:CR=1 FL=1